MRSQTPVSRWDQHRLVVARLRKKRFRHSSPNSGCGLCRSLEYAINLPNWVPSTTWATRRFRFQIPACHLVDNPPKHNFVSRTEKKTKLWTGLVAPSNHPNGWRPPNPGVASSQARRAATFFHQFGIPVDGRARVSRPGPHTSGQQLPYSRESPAETKQHSR